MLEKNSTMIEHQWLVISIFLRSLYPILIRSLPTNLFTQSYLRFAALFTITSAFLLYSKQLPSIQDFDVKYWKISFYMILHIFTSYISFLYLSPGVALTLYYLYPIFLYFQSTDHRQLYTVLGWLSLCLLGVIFTQWNLFSLRKNEPVRWIVLGVFCALISAYTEAIFSYAVKYEKDKEQHPMEFLWWSHGLGFFLLTFLTPFAFHWKPLSSSLLIFGFNAIVGVFTLYLFVRSVEVLSVPHISGIVYLGVLFAYIYGWLLYREKIQWYHIVGTLCIFVGIRQLLKVEDSD